MASAPSFAKKAIKRIRRMKMLTEASKASGRSVESLREDIARCKKEHGLSAQKFLEDEVWRLNGESRDAYFAERKKRNSCNHACKFITQANEWSKKTARAELKKASMTDYCDVLSDEEITILAATLASLKEIRAKKKEWLISAICEKSGWTREKTFERLSEARKKGYNIRNFITLGLYRINDDEAFSRIPQHEPKPRVVFTEKSPARIRRRKYESAICDEMGWNEGQLNLHFLTAKANCGCSFLDYYLYDLYKLSPEDQRTYITEETHLKMQLRYCDYQGTQELFENKSAFNRHFHEFVHRRWFVNDDLTYEAFLKNIEGLDEVIVKPLDSLGSHGIKKHRVNESEEQNRSVFNAVMKKPCIVEQIVQQDAEIGSFWNETLNTVRIMSLIDKDGNFHVLNSIIKIGTKHDADNLVAGGLACGIDTKTGIICTNGVSIDGKVFEAHPLSGKPFKGFQIPKWERITKTCEQAARLVPEMPYVGWDIALNSEGEVDIIEGNHNQAGFLVQFPFAISEHIGRRSSIEPYLEFE